MTVLEAPIESLSRAGEYNRDDQVAPYAHLISGGKTTVARMFVNIVTLHVNLRGNSHNNLSDL
ncbi:MAG TPA: BREX system Lon protease-like protein BrxL, partial [Verrucomicrobiota bacterium]|nr:BREX system Lon protease-like protein BrxL [Verrucomicrobiota bacterium]